MSSSSEGARPRAGARRLDPDEPGADAAVELCHRLGERIRTRRTARGLTLRELGARAGVSQRFLVSLEAGRGNPSVATLAAIARALGASAAELLAGAERAEPAAGPRPVLALLGLRGAGKTAVGKRVAHELGVAFVELDARVAERAGMTLESLFELHGVEHYRRLEREELLRLLAAGERVVVATGGGLPTDPESWSLLRRAAVTVYLRASAEDHWNRVVAQGDARPMHDRRDAMHELRAILRARGPLYAEAEHTVDTTALGLEGSVAAVVGIARGEARRAQA
ncbi:MAG: helix-turn-helix domain-containing protein [Polyangiaceae bacterium]|nr:helix-turn-helix domain-containing protein [Polyangiaceae bacterium]